MLWLPKWLRESSPPPEREPEGVSRRTFLMAGGMAAAGLFLPSPPSIVVAEDVGGFSGLLALIDDSTYRQNYFGLPRGAMLMHHTTAKLYRELLGADARYVFEDADGNVLFNVSDAQRRFMEDE